MAVLVAGMHASGTSAVARLLSLLGVPLGWDVSDLHWESGGLMLFQERLLRRLGGSWDAPPLLRPGWQRRPDLLPSVARGREVIAWTHRGLPFWAWKDPRTCLTFPFWRRVLGGQMLAVAVYRHPLELALAMQARDGFEPSRALALWERYNCDLLTNTVGLPRFVVSYEQMVANPLPTADALRAFLARNDLPTPELAADAITTFIRPELRHAKYEQRTPSLEQQLTEQQRKLAHRLTTLTQQSLAEFHANDPISPRSLTGSVTAIPSAITR